MVVNIGDYKTKSRCDFNVNRYGASESVDAKSLTKRREEKLREQAIKKIREEAKNIKW